jgi:hypothetical protein
MQRSAEGLVAECFWPDVKEADLDALDRRVARALGELTSANGVRYLGSILLREDEVVLCEFEGSVEAVREVARRAGLPCERILAAATSGSRASRIPTEGA